METYDLIIIGGGMSGISMAHYFRNHNILLLEKGELLQEASGKNAGFVLSGFGEHFSSTVKRWGIERAREIQEMHLSSHRRLRELAASIECGYRHSGSYAVALDEKERAELVKSTEMMRSNGYPVEWIESPGVGLKNTMGALWNPDDACLNPASFWNELARGIPGITECEVGATFDERESIRVITTKGDFLARRVIFCLNAFATRLVPELEGRFIPIRGQMLELPLAVDPPSECPAYTRYGDIYWRFSGRSLLFGGLEALFPEYETGIAGSLSREIQQAQLEWVRGHFDPLLFAARAGEDLRPTRAWCSTMAFTVDGFPFVGELPRRNHYVLSGLCGLGLSYALEAAFRLYDKIVHDRDNIPSYCSSDRIDRLPVISGGNWRIKYEAWDY